MTFAIALDGSVRAVSIERVGRDRYRVSVDGKAHVVDAARVGEYGLSLLLDGNGVSREVQVVASGGPGELLVTLDGRATAVSVNGRRSRRGAAESSGRGHGEQKIVAPMPGRIIRVLVGPGDAVAARQPLVVVEAMKMENELRSPKAGTIKEVTVSAGMSVDAGRVLVTVS